MSKKVLLTGGTGLVGTRLTDLLLQKGYQVSHLARSPRLGKVPAFRWNPGTGELDVRALEGVSAIIHLAGAGVADKRWTPSRKHEILESRTQSSALLLKTLATTTHQVRSVVSASAIGYYGFGQGEHILTEESPPGQDFLAQVTRQWEAEVDKITSLGIRVVKLRIGIVLSEKGGALTEMAKPIRWYVGAPLASGKQYLSWIHLDDLCALFLKAVEDDRLQGPYNAVSGEWATNTELTKIMARELHKPLWLPPIPGLALKLVLGEMANMVINGNKVSADKVKRTGFHFQYTNLEEAIKSLQLQKR